VELYDAMRTTFAAREFTGEPLPDGILYRILDNARFAPSGGNRQGVRLVIVRAPHTRKALADLALPGARRYIAQMKAGENPWNSIVPCGVDPETIACTEVPPSMTRPLLDAAVVLVVCLDLRVVASTDMALPRVGVVSGASVYPLVWNILLAARNEGFGGTITTVAIAEEPAVKALLGIPERCAVCAVVPLGRPVKQLTRLKRLEVPAFTMQERWDGAPLQRP
jgi:nitroreductase